MLQALDLDQGQELPVDNCCRPHPRKTGGDGTDRRSCPPRQGSALKGFLRKKKEQKEVGKASTGNRSPIFRCAQDRRALPLSYVKNNVVTQDGPPCSGLSADMIGLRPITSHALQRHIPSCCTAFGLPLGQAASRFLSGAVGLPVPLLQSPTLARRRRL